MEPVDDDEDDAIDVEPDHIVKGSASCNCPKDCDVTEYSTEMSSAPLDIDSIMFTRLSGYVPALKALEEERSAAEDNGDNEEAEDIEKKIDAYQTTTSLVHIYFKQLGIVKYIRDERYGIMDVICNTLAML